MKQRKNYNQNGLVSIMIASVMMILMSLITLGFTRVVQNEQRQALDNQLSRQAFYAAESGINIAASSPSFSSGTAKTDCDVSDYNDGVIDPAEPEVSFTCILINPTPDDLVFNNDSITTNKSKVVPLKISQDPATLTFEWRDNNRTEVLSGCSDTTDYVFATDSESWGKVAPLKLDIIAVPKGSFDRSSLISNQLNTIFYPCNDSASSSVVYSSLVGDAVVGKVTPVNCSNSGFYQCRITITDVPATATDVFYARFNALYNEVNVRITANDASNNRLTFSDAQTVVDSTGRANDVFQRLQARIPMYNNYNIPNAGVQTLGDFCKLYKVQQDQVLDECN